LPWGDRAIGIILGIALGIAIIAIFVFVFSEETIDSAGLEGGDQAGQAEPAQP
jgi:hypothetical protein